MGLKVKYWKGWFSPETIGNPGTWELWKKETMKANSEKAELVIFKIPKGDKPGKGTVDYHEAVNEIEQLLQAKFGK